MIEIAKKKECCGCGACVQACPKNCISMVEDGEGFLYPQVEQSNCVNCGACDRACPMQQQGVFGPSVIGAYAAYTNDEAIRKDSSSGGAFTALAQWVLDNQGVVIGAAFAEDYSVHHVLIEREEDLLLLRGSKYLQSRIDNTYREAKTALESGRLVLFSGVGCQIAGLKAFLGKDYVNLYTVDVLCHGVPSPEIWQRYLREQIGRFDAEIVDISFRRKISGWKRYSIELTFGNGKRYSKTNSEDVFMKCFLSNICLRPSCYDCRFKAIPRMSDITIGDAWGVGNHMPDLDDDQGTSVILINTQKGQQLWDEIRHQMKVRQGDVDVLLPKDADSRRSVRAHPRRSRFFAAASQGASMEELERLSRRTVLQKTLSMGKRLVKRLLKA